MAVFRAGVHFPVNFSRMYLGDFRAGSIEDATASQFTFVTPQTRSEFYGTGFTYLNPPGMIGGTLLARGEYAYGVFHYGISGINVSFQQTLLLTLDAAFAGADDIGGSPHDDNLMGMGGNDALQGFDGNDVLRGGTGNDYLDGGSGLDGMYGDFGDDVYVVMNYGDGVVEDLGPGGGTDTVFSYVNYVMPDYVENLHLFSSVLSATGNSSDNLVYGNEQANAIDSASGNDTVYGFGGADALFGGNGLDVLYGGSGNDVIDGWFSNDVLSGEDGDDSIFGGSGSDTIVGGLGDDILAGEHYAEGTGIASNDLIAGGFGDDLILGGADHDTLYGEFGDDVILGGSGYDVITGGPGADELDGGANNDLFRYTSIADYYPDGGDTITNFSVSILGSDGFDLVQLFHAVGAPALTVADARAQGWLRVVQFGSTALVQFDINGGGDNFGTVARLVDVTAASVTDNMFLI